MFSQVTGDSCGGVSKIARFKCCNMGQVAEKGHTGNQHSTGGEDYEHGQVSLCTLATRLPYTDITCWCLMVYLSSYLVMYIQVKQQWMLFLSLLQTQDNLTAAFATELVDDLCHQAIVGQRVRGVRCRSASSNNIPYLLVSVLHIRYSFACLFCFARNMAQ